MDIRPLHISVPRAIELLLKGVSRYTALRIAKRLEYEGDKYKNLVRRIREGRFGQVR